MWSGGETSELFIYPEGSIFSERDFGFRISSATVEIEASDFTSLPKYNRLLTVLEGELEIIHEGKYSTQLSAFESDAFHGSWITKSRGKAKDFNVIYSDDYILDFTFLEVVEYETFYKKSDFLFLFVLSKTVELEENQFSQYDLIEVLDSIALEKGWIGFVIQLNSVSK